MAPTQDALYADIDLELSWSERDLPERERTKHVHRLHPYLGKFIPQLAEVLLRRYLPRGGRVLDPFAMVGPEKQRRLRHAAETWLAARPALDGLEPSFEVVAVRGGRLERLVNAF